MKKRYRVLLILLIVVMVALTMILFNGKKMNGSVESGSHAETEETVSSEETLPDEESGSEQVDEYIVELDEDETFEIN